MPDAYVRAESFPFDSVLDGYDDYGYPIYDRAVGATLLRTTYKKFFSNGVFGSPANALQIGKGAGLRVTIQPGIFIIEGAMGGVYGSPIEIELDSAPPQGRVPYSIMLRYDNTSEHRSLYFTIEKGYASATPVPPDPDQTSPDVYELRLGWVDVPSGATDLSGATIHNEKGTEKCPYTNPFNEIDLSEVVNDAKSQGQDAVNALLESVKQYYQMIEESIDGTYAGQVEQRLQEVEAEIAQVQEDSITSDKIDNVTIGFSDVDTDSTNDPKFHVIAQGARNAMGLGNTLGALPVSSGGTGVTSLADLSESMRSVVGALTSVSKSGTKTVLGISCPDGRPVNDFSYAIAFVSYVSGAIGKIHSAIMFVPISKILDGTFLSTGSFFAHISSNSSANVEAVGTDVTISGGSLKISTSISISASSAILIP